MSSPLQGWGQPVKDSGVTCVADLCGLVGAVMGMAFPQPHRLPLAPHRLARASHLHAHSLIISQLLRAKISLQCKHGHKGEGA